MVDIFLSGPFFLDIADGRKVLARAELVLLTSECIFGYCLLTRLRREHLRRVSCMVQGSDEILGGAQTSVAQVCCRSCSKGTHHDVERPTVPDMNPHPARRMQVLRLASTALLFHITTSSSCKSAH